MKRNHEKYNMALGLCFSCDTFFKTKLYFHGNQIVFWQDEALLS